MHTFNGKNGTTIHHNGDLSGEVIITRRSGRKDYRGELLPEITFDDNVRLDGEDLIEFVADYVRMQKITKLEEMSTEDVLGIEKRKRNAR